MGLPICTGKIHFKFQCSNKNSCLKHMSSSKYVIDNFIVIVGHLITVLHRGLDLVINSVPPDPIFPWNHFLVFWPMPPFCHRRCFLSCMNDVFWIFTFSAEDRCCWQCEKGGIPISIGLMQVTPRVSKANRYFHLQRFLTRPFSD